jgi:hypothetical protein
MIARALKHESLKLLQGRSIATRRWKQYRRKDGTVIWGHVSVARAPESEMLSER